MVIAYDFERFGQGSMALPFFTAPDSRGESSPCGGSRHRCTEDRGLDADESDPGAVGQGLGLLTHGQNRFAAGNAHEPAVGSPGMKPEIPLAALDTAHHQMCPTGPALEG